MIIRLINKLEKHRCSKCPAHTGGFNGEDYDDDCLINSSYGEKICWMAFLPHWIIRALTLRVSKKEEIILNEYLVREMEKMLDEEHAKNYALEQALKKLLLPCRSCVHEKILGHVDFCGDCEYWCEIPGAKDCWQFDETRFKEPEPLNCDTCAEPTKRVLSWGDGGTERKPVYVYEYTCDNLQCPIAIAREQKKQDEKKHREAVHNENLKNGVDMKHLRNLRINSDYLIFDCAEYLGVTTAIYSAYDCEKNPMPRDLYDRMVQFLKEARP